MSVLFYNKYDIIIIIQIQQLLFNTNIIKCTAKLEIIITTI
jgi:hypothetical protein